MSILASIYEKAASEKKQLAVLIDPDKTSDETAGRIADASALCADYIFVGGSLLTNDRVAQTIKVVKEKCQIPVVLFPGNTMQINSSADAILFLSLISGRNPEMLIGKHVIAAPYLKNTGLEVLPTGYMLVESGRPTAAQYMSNSTPIPYDKDDIAVCTAIAGEMLGLRIIYMDGGSGAANTLRTSMISRVKASISVPLIVGGGICTPHQASEICKAGADLIVVGNAIEKDPSLIKDICKAIKD